MLRTTKAKVIGLILVGVVALGGAVYATTALAAGSPPAAPLRAQATQIATDSQLRSTILDMLKDRMGLTGPDAEKFADQMIARMQNANPGFDLQAMVNWCTQFINADTNGSGPVNGGWGMMNGSGSTNGSGMMNGSGWGDYSGWGMMNGATTPSTGASDPSSATPSSPGPRDSGSGFTPGGMMGGGMMGAAGLR